MGFVQLDSDFPKFFGGILYCNIAYFLAAILRLYYTVKRRSLLDLWTLIVS